MKPVCGPLLFVVLLIVAATPAFAQAPGVEQFLVQSPAVSVASTDTARAGTPSPCDDPVLVQLKARPLDSLSTREYEYFMQKTKECADHRRAVLLDPTPRKPHIREQTGISSFDPEPGDLEDGPDSGGVTGLLLAISLVALTISIAALYQLSHIFDGLGR